MAANTPTHIVKGNVFDALGFSTSEASALKIKAEILSAILEHIRHEGYSQTQLVSLLDEYQPSVGNLLKGRITQVSIVEMLNLARLFQAPLWVTQDIPRSPSIAARRVSWTAL